MQDRQAGNRSPEQWYTKALEQGFVADTAQQQAVIYLQKSYQALCAGSPAKAGIYLWGPVGRGKTWLMDRFYENLPVPGLRQHFHHFMHDLHRRLHQLTGSPEPLSKVADELAQQIRVLCFDEFFISDIADAMLLGPLMQALFERGLAIVMTSNQPPEGLYPDGFNREQLLPTIAALRQHMRIVAVDGSQDHRLHGLSGTEHLPRYLHCLPGQPEAMPALFDQLAGDRPQSREPIELNKRLLDIRAEAGRMLWCDFSQLCEQPFFAQDFIELCQRYDVLLLSKVPELGGEQQAAKIARGTEDAASRVVAGDRVLPSLARKDDAVRRFIALIDECYEGKVPVYIEASVPLSELYTQGYLSFAFRRTHSRLLAMQHDDFAGTV